MKQRNIKSSILFTVLILFQITACKDQDDQDEPTGWRQIPGFEKQRVEVIHVLGSSIYVGGRDSIYVSTDNAKSWKTIVTGLPIPDYSYWLRSFGSLLVNDTTYLFAGTVLDGIYRSTDNGKSWQEANNGIGNGIEGYFVRALGSCDGVVYATVQVDMSIRLYYSTNRGQWWSVITNAPTEDFYGYACIGNRIFLATNWNGVVSTSDKGQSWTSTWNYETNTSDVGLFETQINAITTNGKDVFAVGDYSIHYSTDGGNYWNRISPDSIAPPGEIIAVMKDSTVMVGYFVSHNYGRTWSEEIEGLPLPSRIQTSAILGDKIYIGLNDGLWVNPSILK
ncbi:hypothetical protein JNL27_08360 [bacterium]|nr:hypothetical protein [bacterium]